MHRRPQVCVEVRDDEEFDGGLHLRRRVGEGVHDRDEAVTIRTRLEQSSGGEELDEEPAQHGLDGLGPGRGGKFGASTETILKRTS